MKFPSLLPILLFLLTAPPAYPADTGTITGYRAVFQHCTDRTGAPQHVIRRFTRGGGAWVLLVNPRTFETSVEKASAVRIAAGTGNADVTPFDTALARTTAPPHRLQNHGAVRASGPVKGQFLTVDLCPSARPFEQGMFETLLRLPQGKDGPVPVAIAVSGAWLYRHPAELAWLKEQSAAHRLKITWVNHSLSHPYDPKAPMDRTFLLSPGIDFEREVLEMEKLLLENGLTPSPFFRFPGLVADGALIRRLKELSIIPLGADAWLAKGETASDGSIILVHGNGNEPTGIRKLIPLLQRPDLYLLPLRQAFPSAVP